MVKPVSYVVMPIKYLNLNLNIKQNSFEKFVCIMVGIWLRFLLSLGVNCQWSMTFKCRRIMCNANVVWCFIKLCETGSVIVKSWWITISKIHISILIHLAGEFQNSFSEKKTLWYVSISDHSALDKAIANRRFGLYNEFYRDIWYEIASPGSSKLRYIPSYLVM